MKIGHIKLWIWAVICFGFLLGTSMLLSAVYVSEDGAKSVYTPPAVVPAAVTHIKMPDAVKAIYMTNFIAGEPLKREALFKLIDETEVNAVVLDIKDYTGKIGFNIPNQDIRKLGAVEVRIRDIDKLLAELHARNIYVIGRMAVMQDMHLTHIRPELGIRKLSNQTEVWSDDKGIRWLDPGAREAWDYNVTIAKEAYKLGFDEINFDFIRFPVDGDIENMYTYWSGNRNRSDVIEEFYSYLYEHLKGEKVARELGGEPIISGDLFGMVPLSVDDMAIGQVWERALPYFDVLAPMTYPSHFGKGFGGVADPNKEPYKIIRYALDAAVERTLYAASTTATSVAAMKVRPWLQDFDYGADYDAQDVRAQIRAVYESGLTSWMLWNAANVYTRSALVEVEPRTAIGTTTLE